MKFSLDTNTCIDYLNQIKTPIRTRLQSLQPSDVVVCSVVRAELLYGARTSRDSHRMEAALMQFLSPFATLPFDDSATSTYADIRADLKRKGTPIGPNDLLIAAIAKAHSLTLVTHNTGEFSRVEGLLIEDWAR